METKENSHESQVLCIKSHTHASKRVRIKSSSFPLKKKLCNKAIDVAMLYTFTTRENIWRNPI